MPERPAPRRGRRRNDIAPPPEAADPAQKGGERRLRASAAWARDGPTRPAVLIATVLVPNGAAVETPEIAAVRRYLAAPDLSAALASLSPDYRLWFDRRDGEGIPRSAVADMLTWDFALHPSHEIRQLSQEGSLVRATIHKQNDLARLIDFPGWDAQCQFTVIDMHILPLRKLLTTTDS